MILIKALSVGRLPLCDCCANRTELVVGLSEGLQLCRDCIERIHDFAVMHIKKPGTPKDIRRLLGAWPGDETAEQLLGLLGDMKK